MENTIEKTTSGEMVPQTNDNNSIVEPINQGQVEGLIERAIEKKTPVETMEKLLAMRRELRAEWATAEYDKAMAAFQMECPVIKKSQEGGKTNSGVVAYKYAPLDVIVNQTKELIGKHGFSYSTKTWTEGDRVKVTVFVRHIAGHMESSTMEVPLGTKTNVMSAPQVVAAATTFAKRYAFCNAFGILTGDEDNDGNTNKLSETQMPSKTPVTPPAAIPQATNPERKMRAVFEVSIKGCKTKADLNSVATQIEASKKRGELTDADVSMLRGLFRGKDAEIKQ